MSEPNCKPQESVAYVIIREVEYEGDLVVAVSLDGDRANVIAEAEDKRCPLPFRVRHRVEEFELR